MRHILLACIFFTFLNSCGESKKDLESRQQLSSIIRQTNIAMETIYSESKKRNNFDRQLYKAYEQNLSELRSIKMQNASKIVTEKFIGTRKNIDSVLSRLIKTSEMRKDLLDMTIELEKDMHEFNSARELDAYLRTSGSKALVKNIAFFWGKGFVKQRKLINTFDNTCIINSQYASTQNIVLKKLKFADTFNVLFIKPDTTDVVHSCYQIAIEFGSVEDEFKEDLNRFISLIDKYEQENNTKEEYNYNPYSLTPAK